MFKDILGEVFPVIEKAAPIFASVLGSPLAGGATSIALNLLGTAFGVNPAQIEDLKTAIKSNPRSEDIIGRLEDMFSAWIKSNGDMIMPRRLEVNVKLEWPDDNSKDQQ